MSVTVGIHPDEFEIQLFDKRPGDARPFVSLEAREGDGTVTVYLVSAALCDELIKAAVEAKRLLLGDDDPAVLITSEQPAPNLDTANLPAAEADPANPYGPTPLASLREREHYQAAEPVIIVPFQHLPHLPQHTGGNPMCSLCGLDHYALHAIETTGGA